MQVMMAREQSDPRWSGVSSTEVEMRRLMAHAVTLPSRSGFCGIPPGSAFRMKPRSFGSWQLIAASLPMNCQKELPYPELFPFPCSNPHPKIDLNGPTKTWPLCFNWNNWRVILVPKIPCGIAWRLCYNYINFFPLPGSLHLPLHPHAPQVLTQDH